MKKISLFVFLNIINVIILSGQKVAPDTYLIKFKDKANSVYSTDKPLEFLSERAMLRRQKYNIPVNEQDIPVNKNYIDSIKNLGFEIYAVTKWMNAVVVYSKDSTLIDKAYMFDFVDTAKFVKKDKPEFKNPEPEKIEIESKPDTFYTLDYGYGKNQVRMLNLHNLHNKGYTGEGLEIAVLDAGFKNVDKLEGFDSIRTNKQILGVKDFVSRDSDVYRDATHGMQVLSTIAADYPGKLIGTAPKAKFWLLRTEDEHSENLVEEYYWIAGAEFADSAGVDIIHSSLGYNNFDDTLVSFTYKDMNGNTAPATTAADIAASKGILCVTSAGNEGNSPWKYITSPADADSTLTVGAVSGENIIANFSSVGPTPDGRIKPEIVAQGAFVWVLLPKRGVTFSFGTSFSAPIIAGAVACLWQAHPDCTNMEIIDAVIKSADKYTNPDNEYGYGLPDFNKADKYLKMKGK
ncbi:MAG: S8 family serine peptidase [Chlorobi bacterium]|nr:S8 family serine peptidase [Chlorobiota bacterium]